MSKQELIMEIVEEIASVIRTVESESGLKFPDDTVINCPYWDGLLCERESIMGYKVQVNYISCTENWWFSFPTSFQHREKLCRDIKSALSLF